MRITALYECVRKSNTININFTKSDMLTQKEQTNINLSTNKTVRAAMYKTHNHKSTKTHKQLRQ